MGLIGRRGLAGLALAPLAARAAGAALRVAYKADTEGAVLGRLAVGALAAAGIAVVDAGALGTTAIVRGALLAGQVDAYPEYTGNGAFFFQREMDPAWKVAAAGYALVRDLDLAANGVVWLRPAPADNTWAIAVRQYLADAGIASLEDFARYVNDTGRIKLAASAEFVESPAALPAFQAAYGFELRSGQLLQLAGGNTSATLRAAAEGISGVNASMAYATDGALAVLPVRVLSDPRRVQPVYAPALTIRAEALARAPDARTAVEAVFARLTQAVLRGLNERVAVDGEDAASVAAEFLRGG